MQSTIDAATGAGDQGTRIKALRKELSMEKAIGVFQAPDHLDQPDGVGGGVTMGVTLTALRRQLKQANRDDER